MFHFSPRVFVQLTVAGAVLTAAASQVQAQSILATTSTTSTPSNNNKAAWHDTIPSKLISAQVHDGIFSMDGMVAKVQLNYSISNASYMYFFVPGMGTAVVSLSPMTNAIKVKNAFDGSKLAFTVQGHRFELSSNSSILGSDKSDAYVQFDTTTVALARSPRVGYGSTLQSPYVWPASKLSAADKEAHLVQPPPLPANMLPVTVGTQPATAPVAKPQP